MGSVKRRITAKQADRWSSVAASVTGLCALLLMFDVIELRGAAIIAFIANCVAGILTGKGIPSVQTIVQELNINHNPTPPSPYEAAIWPQNAPDPFGRSSPPAPYDIPQSDHRFARNNAPPPEVGRWLEDNQAAFNAAGDDDPITQGMPKNARY